MRSKILALVIALLYAYSAFAGEEKRGTAGFMFLKVPMGAREVSMGQTGLTNTSGASAMFWNPANVSSATSPSFTFSYLNHFAGISTNYAAVAFPVSDIGTFGLSFNYLSYGDNLIKTTELEPNGNIGNFSAYDMAVGFTYSKQITDRVNGGMTLKFVNSHIDLVDASAYAFDFGFTYNTDFQGLKMGFVVSNLGPQAVYRGDGLIRELVDPSNGSRTYMLFDSEPFNLPASVNFGASMDLIRNEQNSITGMVEQNINSFQVSYTNFGMEYGFQNMFFARAGYSSALKKDRNYNTGSNGMSGLTLGAGVDYKFNENLGAAIDYGYLDMGALGGTHRFSVGLKF